jgi:hypothetical protein
MAPKIIPNLTQEEKALFARLDRYLKIQDFLDEIDYNLEEKGETCYSPRLVIRERKANCIEGAIFAAACLYYNGRLPLLGQLIAADNKDDDHVIALYKERGCWGVLSKSKYPALGFREPIFKNLRELSLSYFEGYFSYEGEKSLIDNKGWVTDEKPLFYVADALWELKTVRLLSDEAEKNLRPVTPLMKESGEIWVNKKGVMGYLKQKFKEQ